MYKYDIVSSLQSYDVTLYRPTAIYIIQLYSP